MRIFSVTPIHVGPTSSRDGRRATTRSSPAGVTLDLVDIGPEAPKALDTA